MSASIVLTCLAGSAGAQSNDFRWSGVVQPGKSIEIKGVNGGVKAEFTSGKQVEVVATKSARRSDVNSVSVQVVQENGNVTICAVYPTPDRWYRRNRNSFRDRNSRDDGPNECRPGDGGHMNVDSNDVKVDFTVKVPAGVKFYGKTVNGSITVKLPRNINADVHADMMNGGFESDFPITVQSFRGRNKHIVGTIGTGGRDLDLHTVNGKIHLQSVPN